MGNLFQALRRRRVIRVVVLSVLVGQATLSLSSDATAQTPTAIEYRALLDQYCVTCHNQSVVDDPNAPANALLSQLRAVGLKLDALDLSAVAANADHWEPVVRKLRAGLMPPAGLPRPDPATLDGFRTWLETQLDGATAAHPNPGRTASFHRLNRAEYSNAIRDLLALEIDVDDFLPADDAGYGFDNIGGVLRMSQSLLERYLDASRAISRLAVGSPPSVPFSETFRTAQDEQQHERGVGLPFGTRGGVLLSYLFPLDADYDLHIQLSGTRGLRDEHRLEVTVDGEPIEQFTIGSASTIALRLPVAAGPRDIGVAFYRKPPVLVEQVRERFQNPRTAGNSGGPGGAMPFVSSVTIAGPYNASGPGQTPSRDRVFSCQPATVDEEPACARSILSDLARRAYRRPVSDDDVEVLLEFYAMGRASDSGLDSAFESGIELALRRLLVSPEFLIRIETDPADIAPDYALRGDRPRAGLPTIVLPMEQHPG